MRINGYNGIVKWTTVVLIKNNNSGIFIEVQEVNSDDIIFISYKQDSNIFCKYFKFKM